MPCMAWNEIVMYAANLKLVDSTFNFRSCERYLKKIALVPIAQVYPILF